MTVALQRRSLLDEYFAVYRRLDGAAAGDELTPQIKADFVREIELREAYVAQLPIRAISRCPHTANVLRLPIDDEGLDGLWWSYEAAAGRTGDLPGTFFALAGAVALAGDAEPAPFLAKPGPEVPFVVPRLLGLPSVRAVISSIRIGRHRGYAVAYFADPAPVDAPRWNTWGSNEYRDGTGPGAGWHSVVEDPGEMDFELAPWIADGRVSWIAPDDPDLELRHDAGSCPYLDLPGRRSILRIREGRVWTPEDLA